MDTDPFPPNTPPDETPPSAERQAELRAAIAANEAQQNALLHGVHLRTKGELDWVCEVLH